MADKDNNNDAGNDDAGNNDAASQKLRCVVGLQQYCEFMHTLLSISNTTYALAESNLTFLRKLLYICKMVLTSENVLPSSEMYAYVTALFVQIRYYPPFDGEKALMDPLNTLCEFLHDKIESHLLQEWVSKSLPMGSLQGIVLDICALKL